MPFMDAAGVIRPGMFENQAFDESVNAVGVPTSGRGNKTTMVAQGPDAVADVPFCVRTANPMMATLKAAEAGAIKRNTPALFMAPMGHHRGRS